MDRITQDELIIFRQILAMIKKREKSASPYIDEIYDRLILGFSDIGGKLTFQQ